MNENSSTQLPPNDTQPAHLVPGEREKDVEEQVSWDNLNSDILELIFSWLTPTIHAHLSLVNRRWNKIVMTSRSLWENVMWPDLNSYYSVGHCVRALPQFLRFLSTHQGPIVQTLAIQLDRLLYFKTSKYLEQICLLKNIQKLHVSSRSGRSLDLPPMPLKSLTFLQIYSQPWGTLSQFLTNCPSLVTLKIELETYPEELSPFIRNSLTQLRYLDIKSSRILPLQALAEGNPALVMLIHIGTYEIVQPYPRVFCKPFSGRWKREQFEKFTPVVREFPDFGRWLLFAGLSTPRNVELVEWLMEFELGLEKDEGLSPLIGSLRWVPYRSLLEEILTENFTKALREKRFYPMHMILSGRDRFTHKSNLTNLLLSKRCSVDGRDSFGATPLLCAARGGQAEWVSLLLSLSANPNASDSMGGTPLLCAIEQAQNKGKVIELLVSGGARVNGHKPSLLSRALANCDIPVIQYLMKNGAILNNDEEEFAKVWDVVFSPLFKQKRSEIIGGLFSAGLKCTFKPQSPLILALALKEYDVCSLITKEFHDPKLFTTPHSDSGWTPFHYLMNGVCIAKAKTNSINWSDKPPELSPFSPSPSTENSTPSTPFTLSPPKDFPSSSQPFLFGSPNPLSLPSYTSPSSTIPPLQNFSFNIGALEKEPPPPQQPTPPITNPFGFSTSFSPPPPTHNISPSTAFNFSPPSTYFSFGSPQSTNPTPPSVFTFGAPESPPAPVSSPSPPSSTPSIPYDSFSTLLSDKSPTHWNPSQKRRAHKTTQTNTTKSYFSQENVPKYAWTLFKKFLNQLTPEELNQPNMKMETPIMLALRNGDATYEALYHTISLLLDKNVDIHTSDKQLSTILHLSAMTLKQPIDEFVNSIWKGPLEPRDSFGSTPFLQACKAVLHIPTTWNFVQYFKEKKIDLNATDVSKLNAIHYLSIPPHSFHLLKTALEYSIDLNAVSVDGETPLTVALAHMNWESSLILTQDPHCNFSIPVSHRPLLYLMRLLDLSVKGKESQFVEVKEGLRYPILDIKTQTQRVKWDNNNLVMLLRRLFEKYQFGIYEVEDIEIIFRLVRNSSESSSEEFPLWISLIQDLPDVIFTTFPLIRMLTLIEALPASDKYIEDVLKVLIQKGCNCRYIKDWIDHWPEKGNRKEGFINKLTSAYFQASQSTQLNANSQVLAGALRWLLTLQVVEGAPSLGC